MEYKIGDEIWRLYNQKAIKEVIVGSYYLGKNTVYATRGRTTRSEINGWDFLEPNEIFPTKESLIASL